MVVLAWYLHQVIEYQGYRLKAGFPFSKQYWRKVNEDNSTDNDEWAIANNYTSLVPCAYDLTAHKNLEYLTTNFIF